MSLQRQLIRKKVADLLSTPPIPLVKGVHVSRQVRVSADETPCILIYTKSESADEWVAAPREYKCTLKLVVEACAINFTSEGKSVDDLLDELSEQIRQRLFQNETLDGLASDTKLSDTEIDFITDSEDEIGVCRTTFDVTYSEASPKEQSGLDNFETYHAEYKVDGSTPATVPMIDESELDQ